MIREKSTITKNGVHPQNKRNGLSARNLAAAVMTPGQPMACRDILVLIRQNASTGKCNRIRRNSNLPHPLKLMKLLRYDERFIEHKTTPLTFELLEGKQ